MWLLSDKDLHDFPNAVQQGAEGLTTPERMKLGGYLQF